MTAATGDRSPTITVDRLTKRHGDRPVVEGLSFSMSRGVVTGFLGPNGSGKNTPIRAIFGLIHPTSETTLVPRRPFASWISLPPIPTPHRRRGAHPKRNARNHLGVIASERDVVPSRVDDVVDLVELTGDGPTPTARRCASAAANQHGGPWTAAHVVPGDPTSDIGPEHASCNYGAGATPITSGG
jgi:ABC-type cobalamin/Fe3+-siderophores transport system ATPase subunit